MQYTFEPEVIKKFLSKLLFAAAYLPDNPHNAQRALQDAFKFYDDEAAKGEPR